MSLHHATVRWARAPHGHEPDTYAREHTASFPGGTNLPMSAAVEYKGDPAHTNPEELLVAALSSCHMLTFLAIAARKGMAVERYEDDAEGVLEKDESGVLAVTRVTLRPRIVFGGPPPEADVVARLHESAHRGCFIANSVKTRVTVEA